MISVIFSSHNGGDDLRRTLDSITKVEAPPGGWRLIAVDNASTDGTGDLLRSYEDRIPLTVLLEPRPGKNIALNRAIDIADGDLYVFTDDDVVVRTDWLAQWRAVADAQPDYELFAGRTQALFPHDPPAWLLKNIDVPVLYAGHRRVEDGPCEPVDMYGTNMALRASVFADGVRYATSIGPDGTPNYPMGSDTELARRLVAQGLKSWFAAGPAVEHIVRPEYLEPAWILRRGYRWGRGLARMNFDFYCAPEVLSRKNTLKALVYPLLLPILGRDERWRRQWLFMVDRGYEDGTRDDRGLKPRWT